MSLGDMINATLSTLKETTTSAEDDTSTTTATTETTDAEAEAATSYIYIADYFSGIPAASVPTTTGFNFQTSTTIELSKASATSTSYTIGLDLMEAQGCITIGDDMTYTHEAGEFSTIWKSIVGGAMAMSATNGDLSHLFSTIGYGISFEFDAAQDTDYPVTYHEAELAGLRSRYGYMTQDSIVDYLDEGIKTLTKNIVATLYENKYTFKKVKSPELKKERLFTLAETADQRVTIKTSTMEKGVTISMGSSGY